MKRIKADALQTRNDILDAAERVFHRRGLSRPTLEEIAHEAGVTRGAIYWHFKNKCEVFRAMCERVELPAEAAFGHNCGASATPLDALRALVEEWLVHTLSASHERRLFEILNYKCELVEENGTVLERRRRVQSETVACIQDFLDKAVQLGQLHDDVDTGFAASMMHAFIHGAISARLLEDTPLAPAQLAGEAARIAALALDLPQRCRGAGAMRNEATSARRDLRHSH